MIKSDVKTQWKGNAVKVQGKQVTNASAFQLGLVVEGQAKLLCPVDYGYLAASITTQSRSKGTDLDTPTPSGSKTHEYPHDVSTFKKIAPPNDDNEVLVGTAVDYAPYQEFGTVRNVAQPFLRPALDLAQGKVLTIVQENGKFYFREYLR